MDLVYGEDQVSDSGFFLRRDTAFDYRQVFDKPLVSALGVTTQAGALAGLAYSFEKREQLVTPRPKAARDLYRVNFTYSELATWRLTGRQRLLFFLQYPQSLEPGRNTHWAFIPRFTQRQHTGGAETKRRKAGGGDLRRPAARSNAFATSTSAAELAAMSWRALAISVETRVGCGVPDELSTIVLDAVEAAARIARLRSRRAFLEGDRVILGLNTRYRRSVNKKGTKNP